MRARGVEKEGLRALVFICPILRSPPFPRQKVHLYARARIQFVLSNPLSPEFPETGPAPEFFGVSQWDFRPQKFAGVGVAGT